MKSSNRHRKPAVYQGLLGKSLVAVTCLSALQGVSEASVILTARGENVAGGDYSIQEYPGLGVVHMVQGGGGGMVVQNNHSSIYQWSFGYLYFDLSGQSEEVSQAILTLEIKGASGAGGNSDTPAAFDLYVLTSDYQDLDGTDDGDFRDYIQGAVPSSQTGAPPNYLAVEGVPDKATEWYDSQFGPTIPPVATLTFEGNDVGDFGSVDITDLVNDWISGRTQNKGIGLLLTSPDVFRISIEGGNSEVRSNPTLTLTQVPEPASALLVAMAGLAGLGLRRRGKSSVSFQS